MKQEKNTQKETKERNYTHYNDNPETPDLSGVDNTQSKRWKFGGSYTSGKKRISQATRTKKGDKKKSQITGVDVRGKQIENRRP